MNHIYRLVWSAVRKALVPAAETSCRSGKAGKMDATHALLPAVAALLFVTGSAYGAAVLPEGGVVVHGKAKINSGNDVLNVKQTSDRAVIKWDSFSVGAGAKVNFKQPGPHAVTLNRVAGESSSLIDGSLSANGHVYLINPNGILFAEKARVDVAGLVASTLNVRDADFMNASRSSLVFKDDGISDGLGANLIVNKGQLEAADGGDIVLLGRRVTNDGVIKARLGTVALAAGGKISLDFATGSSVIGVTVTEAALKAMVLNTQAIHADGGRVILDARALEQTLDQVVNTEGEIRAQSIQDRKGEIRLVGNDGAIRIAGTLDVSGREGNDGGQINTDSRLHVQENVRLLANGALGRQDGTLNISSADLVIDTGAKSSYLLKDLTTQALRSALTSGRGLFNGELVREEHRLTSDVKTRTEVAKVEAAVAQSGPEVPREDRSRALVPYFTNEEKRSEAGGAGEGRFGAVEGKVLTDTETVAELVVKTVGNLMSSGEGSNETLPEQRPEPDRSQGEVHAFPNPPSKIEVQPASSRSMHAPLLGEAEATTAAAQASFSPLHITYYMHGLADVRALDVMPRDEGWRLEKARSELAFIPTAPRSTTMVSLEGEAQGVLELSPEAGAGASESASTSRKRRLMSAVPLRQGSKATVIESGIRLPEGVGQQLFFDVLR